MTPNDTPYGGTIPPVTTTTTEATVAVPTTTPAAEREFALTGSDVYGMLVILVLVIVAGIGALAGQLILSKREERRTRRAIYEGRA